MAKVNKTKYAILGVLSLMPCSGYDIKKFCDQSIAHFWSENYGHIYPVLKQLETDGLISKETKYTDGKPPRNVYRLTDSGRSELGWWLMQPAESQPPRVEFLLQLFFSKNLPRDIMLSKLTDGKAELEKLLQKYNEIEAALKNNKEHKDDENFPFWIASVRAGIYDVQSKIDWCNETIESLTSFYERLNQKGESGIENINT